MAKWQVRYELRDYFTRTVEADSAEEAEEIVCNECYDKHRSDVYDIHWTKIVKDTEHDDR